MFTFAAMAAIAFSASAQTESAFVDAVGLLGAEATTTAVSLEAGVEVCKSANVTMTAAFDDTYKIVEMTGEADPSNQVTIDGVPYKMTTGIQGQTNPKVNNITDKGAGLAGAVFGFNVKADGVLYVFGKLTGNKTYYVWEGDVNNGQAEVVGYTLQGQLLSTSVYGKTISYTLPGDEMNWYQVGNGYDNGKVLADASWCTDVAAGLANWGESNATNTFGTIWTEGNALGVIAFPVYAEVGEYYVHAVGSKITSNGFVFVPGATTVSTVSYTKDATGTGIANINAENAKAAPVKVIKDGQIMIGDFNIAGQRVK